jgi:hypothetical protein
MGLFSSPIPQPPLPKIAIDLYCSNDKVFRPDELVSGRVTFTPVAPIAPRALEVSLFGESLVWYRTSTSSGDSTDYHHWRDNAPLFEIATDVIQTSDSKALILQPGETYIYPFNFRFPAGTNRSRACQYKNNADELWTVAPHDLPPSFLIASKYGRNGEEPSYAKIEYGVRVRLRCPGIGIVQGPNVKDLAVTAPVRFAPLNHNPPPYAYGLEAPVGMPDRTQGYTLQTSVLAGQAASSIGFRQSMRDRFSSQTPTLGFGTTVDIPPFLTCGAEFPIRTSFRVLSKSGNVAHIPGIRFTILALQLKDITNVRAPRDLDASTMMSGNHRKNKYENMPLANAPYSGREHQDTCRHETPLNTLPTLTTVELEETPSGEKKAMEQASSCEAWFTARVPSSTPPSFRSFAISKSYQVKVTLGIEQVKSVVKEMRSAPAPAQ